METPAARRPRSGRRAIRWRTSVVFPPPWGAWMPTTSGRVADSRARALQKNNTGRYKWWMRRSRSAAPARSAANRSASARHLVQSIAPRRSTCGKAGPDAANARMPISICHEAPVYSEMVKTRIPMRRRPRFWFQVVALGALAAACGQSTTPTPSPPAVTSVTVTGTVALPAPGLTSQLVATATFADGTSQVVTNQATWQSSNPTVATVTTTGLVAALTYGTATVTAAFRGVNGSATVAITLNMTGTWKGTASDSAGSAAITSVLTQTGTVISGTASLVYTSGTQATGSFSGTVSNTGSTVNFTVTGSGSTGGVTCTLTLTGVGQILNITFTGTYGGSNSCSGAVANGQMTMVKQ